MKQCPVCGAMHADQQAVCPCGADLTRLPPIPPAPPPPPAGLGNPPPPFMGRPLPPGRGWMPLTQKPYTWADILTVLGFSAAVVGYFWAGVLLLPLGLVASVIGFHGNKCRGLAVAGVVVSAIGVLLKIMMMLEESGLLPHWLTDGIFFA